MRTRRNLLPIDATAARTEARHETRRLLARCDALELRIEKGLAETNELLKRIDRVRLSAEKALEVAR